MSKIYCQETKIKSNYNLTYIEEVKTYIYAKKKM